MVFGITSMGCSKNVLADNPYGKRLFEVADVTIDAKIPVGDAALQICSLGQRVASVSTILDAYIIETLVVCVVENMLSKGIKPSIWMEGNVPGGDDYNR